MKDWIAEFFRDYGHIIAGLAAGTFAHFGQLVKLGKWPTAGQVVGFVMQLGLIGLVAAVITEQMNISSRLMGMFTASILTLATNEIVNWARARAVRTAERFDSLTGNDKP